MVVIWSGLQLFVFRQEVASLPGVARWGCRSVLDFLAPVVANGLTSVLLFGVPEKVTKEDDGRAGETEANPVMEAVANIRAKFPGLTIACDVCLCPYTSHGHCGVLHEGNVGNTIITRDLTTSSINNLLSNP